MSLRINDSNYEHYKIVYETIWKQFVNYYNHEIFKNNSPIDILNQWEQKSKQLAKKGISAGLSDLFSMLKEFPPDLRDKIDNALAEKELPGLQKLELTLSNTIKAVLKRGEIKSLDEFYIIKEIVIDETSEISELERISLSNYLGEYEQAQKNKIG